MRKITFPFIFIFIPLFTRARNTDSLIIAQSFVNLSLTRLYFDSLSSTRLAKIVAFIQKDLSTIHRHSPFKQKEGLYNICYSLLYLEKAKLTYRSAIGASRSRLLVLKKEIDSAILFYDRIKISAESDFSPNSFYDFIHFSLSDISRLNDDILCLKDHVAQLFNKNIYPDFKRIFYSFKNKGKFYLDSLVFFQKLFSLDNDNDRGGIFLDDTQTQVVCRMNKIKARYPLAPTLDALSAYLHMQYIVRFGKKVDTVNLYRTYQYYTSPMKDDNSFCLSLSDMNPVDNFYHQELDSAAWKALFHLIQQKFPVKWKVVLDDSDGDGTTDEFTVEPTPRYYFPDQPPFPSSIASIPHFRPALKYAKNVNNYLQGLLQAGGYEGHCHYYYAKGGFAITTDMELTDEYGQPDASLNRWEIAKPETRRMSLYYLFKTIFFSSHIHCRMLALVITPQQVIPQRTKATYSGLKTLLDDSYSSLPIDIEPLPMPDKTISVLIYHFYQDDEGEIPQLDKKHHISVQSFLQSSPLAQLFHH